MRRPHPLAALLIAATAASVSAADQPAPLPAAPAQAQAQAQSPPPARSPVPPPPKPGAQKKGSVKAEYKGPTEADIRTAYQDRVDLLNAGTAQYLDPAAAAKLTIKLVKVDVVECNPAEERQDTYVCSILIEAGVGPGEVEFKRVEVALVKAKDAWRIQ